MNNSDLKEYIDTFDEKYNGNYSTLYPYIKNRLNNYEDMDLPFPGEFLFFEDRYVKIYKDIKARGINANKIIDVGCELGIQSEIFKNEYQYIGIDYVHYNFFNSDNKKCEFLVGRYPLKALNYDNSIVISSMSLGYFFNHENEETYLFNVVEELRKVRYLYIATNRKLIKMLSRYFDIEHLDPPVKSELNIDVSNNLYFMQRK